ncbi:HNH endonuclease [Nodosilinea sp. LEGE 07298]|uniref:HNH endonuclease n=1 Tax=Nodosilinea sp. LEGE 07298 TaxID=2777970 RepID=UPI001882C1AC|nr:HNH endonuclease [Nodosilinea sp. LEGE 07298]MBE9111461.1 HNH endonuclease [Nodosilinea sp. LEGE 07298]
MQALLKLTNRNYDAIISPEDDDLNAESWYETERGYIQQYSPGGIIKLHRLVMERKLGRVLFPNEMVDHRSRVRLDNTRDNLRLATQTLNEGNKGVRRDNSSGYKGVSLMANGKFKATITIERKSKHLKCWLTAVEAALAYDQAAREYFGEFALLNFP